MSETNPPPYSLGTSSTYPEKSEDIELQEPLRQGASPDPDPYLPRNNRRFNMGDNKQVLMIVGGVVGVIAFLVIVLVPISFSTLEYYEYGFRRRKTTGEIDRSKAYGPGGRYTLGPDYEFRAFRADAHFESFNRVTVFASDRLQVTITAHMQYFLRRDQMHLLHKKYDIRYEPILKNNAMDAIKNRATKFETREYIRDRLTVENALFDAVRERLSGPCCEQDCELTDTCVSGCKSFLTCEEDQFGFFVDVRYFQLDALEIPTDLEGKFLKGLVLKEESETEKYKQDAEITRKETDGKVQSILNDAREIRQNGTAQSTLIRSLAQANATAIVEGARSSGLKHLYDELLISEPQHKASFDYLRTLRGHKNIHMAVDYSQLISGPMQP